MEKVQRLSIVLYEVDSDDLHAFINDASNFQA